MICRLYDKQVWYTDLMEHRSIYRLYDKHLWYTDLMEHRSTYRQT